MRNRIGKRALTLTLALMLIFLAALPLIYPYLSSLLAQKHATGFEAVDLNSVPDVSLSPSILLGYANIVLESVQAGNFTRAQIVLGYINHLPPNVEHNLMIYLTQIAELVSIIRSLKEGLDALESLVENGQTIQALRMISQIDSTLTDASTRLGLLYAALDRAAALYRIDVSLQRGRLDGLALMLAQFKQLLESLKDRLRELDRRIATRLTISASPNPVWSNGTLHLTGILRYGNATGLGGRVVELWLNGIRIREVMLDSDGRFGWKYSVSMNRYDKLEIYARYIPAGVDANACRPAISGTAIVPVRFYPVVLTAAPSTGKVHVAETFSVQGSLVNAIQQPLTNETVVLMIDGKPADSSQTDPSGDYVLAGSFPVGSNEGAHTLRVLFNPLTGVYGSTSVGLGVRLYYLRSGVNVTSGAPSFTLSGQAISLGGLVTVGAKPFSQGWIIALIGERELGRAPVGLDGVFTVPVSIPIDISGLSAINLVFAPERPWIISNATSVQLNIINSGLVGFASVGLVAAVVTLSTRTIQLVPASRAKRRESEQIALEKLRAEAVPGSVTIHLARLGQFADLRRRVQETYWEIRHAMVEVLREHEPPSETPREFATRLNRRLADAATPFSLLTLLFEVAEYSEHEITGRDAYAAINYAVLIAEEINVHVKRDETWSEFRKECETKANEALHGLGISALRVMITPTSISVQLPWFLPEQTQTLAHTTLEGILRMPVELIPVRFCDQCQHKLEGSAVKLGVCPECGRRLEANNR